MGPTQGHRGRRWWRQRQGLYNASPGTMTYPFAHSSLESPTANHQPSMQQFPALKFVVQDSADMHAAGQSLLTDDIRGRVSFMQHSFFEPQLVGDAAAYILRACALNWCDQDVVTMFRSLMPGLERSEPTMFRSLMPGLERSEPTTPLLINDLVLPAQGTLTRDFERGMRQIDLIMLVGFGGKLRTEVDFEALLKQADERYEVCSFRPEGLMGLLEVYLRR
jgi:hypothetical protein